MVRKAMVAWVLAMCASACGSPPSITVSVANSDTHTISAGDDSVEDALHDDSAARKINRGTGWLHVKGRHIETDKNRAWQGRGANIQDTRSCNACTSTPDANEVKRRIDVLVDDWHANFLRLTLETEGDAPSILADPNYVRDLQDIVQHIGTKKDVYVELSLWLDPTLDANGWPTPATTPIFQKLVDMFKDTPYVMFGLCNEPQYNPTGQLDGQVWDVLNTLAEAIRTEETVVGSQQHIISVQGTGMWCRRLDYYITHPIQAGGGTNIIYEVHVYDPKNAFNDMIEEPAQHLPVIISEFGPVTQNGNMSVSDCDDLMVAAENLEVPYAAWTFHMRCQPNLIEDLSNGGCGIGMPIKPTPWGQTLQKRLNTRYGRDRERR